MNILFFLDVKLIKKDNQYYTTGAVNYNYLNGHRLTEEDKLVVICREDKDIRNSNKVLSLSSGKNIKFITINNYSEFYKRDIKLIINKEIKKSELCFIKLPSYIGIMSYNKVVNKNKKYIIEMVGCAWDSIWNYGNIIGKLVAPIIFLINKYYVKKSNNVIYVSNSFLQERYPTKGRCISCSNVKLKDVKTEVLEQRIKKINSYKNNQQIKLGLIGSLNVGFKGHAQAIKALSSVQKEYNNIELHFLGAGGQQQWKDLAKRYNVESKVFFDGTLPSGEPVMKWLDEIDIFLMPSLQEGLPRAMIEAMSRGCPIVGMKTGGIPELIDNEFICKKKDYKKMTNKIELLISNRDLMKKQANKNFEESKKYLEKDLNDKRKSFLNMIIKENEV
ncbi:MAG: glycosyltransferase [Clostridia bacterium]|nr:glycosyltransferase [Clostridia bacterium]